MFIKNFDYVQVVQKAQIQKNSSKGQKEKHVLADVIGIMDNEFEELEKIVTREFQQIEGEYTSIIVDLLRNNVKRLQKS